MTTEAVVTRRSVGHRLAGLFQGRPRLQVGTLLAGPGAWLVVLYLGSLAVLLITAFWTVDPLSGAVVQGFSLENFEALVNEPVYRDIVWRPVRRAALVTRSSKFSRLKPWSESTRLNSSHDQISYAVFCL